MQNSFRLNPTKNIIDELSKESSRFEKYGLTKEAEEIISSTKKKHRSELSNWAEMGQRVKAETLQLLADTCRDNVERIDYQKVSREEFIEAFERPNKPAIITNFAEHWSNSHRWSWKYLYKKYKDTRFKLGESDSGRTLRVEFKYFLEYLVKQEDDSPLYLFESSFDDKKRAPKLARNYEVPKYFEDDLFKHLGEDKRPPYRWWLVGPKGSGTTVHLDPLMTSAWNSSIKGHKLWVLFPPETPKSIVKGKDYNNSRGKTEAIDYFSTILPKLKTGEKGFVDVYECIQGPGETIFVPGGWWHAVLNLDDTMAVTQNFMSHTNFEAVWRNMRNGRKKLSSLLMKILHKKKEYLYERAENINKNDSFLMHTDPRRSQVLFKEDITTTSFEYSSTSSSSSSSYSTPSEGADSNSSSSRSVSKSRKKSRNNKRRTRSRSKDNKYNGSKRRN